MYLLRHKQHRWSGQEVDQKEGHPFWCHRRTIASWFPCWLKSRPLLDFSLSFWVAKGLDGGYSLWRRSNQYLWRRWWCLKGWGTWLLTNSLCPVWIGRCCPWTGSKLSPIRHRTRCGWHECTSIPSAHTRLRTHCSWTHFGYTFCRGQHISCRSLLLLSYNSHRHIHHNKRVMNTLHTPRHRGCTRWPNSHTPFGTCCNYPFHRMRGSCWFYTWHRMNPTVCKTKDTPCKAINAHSPSLLRTYLWEVYTPLCTSRTRFQSRTRHKEAGIFSSSGHWQLNSRASSWCRLPLKSIQCRT